ncbi:hypothetical protein PTKIN_Ptkin04bG0165700 [Pterospermum kingtungense]
MDVAPNNEEALLKAARYGTSEDGTKYWSIKNSLVEKWGEGGYMRIKRDVDTPEGLYGIATMASHPIA